MDAVTVGRDDRRDLAAVRRADELRAAAKTDLAPSGLTTYVTGPGGVTADFVTAFGGIDGILLGVALGVVFVILLIVYRSPILPFAVLLTAVFGLAAAALAVFPLAKNDVIGAERPEPGHPVDPGRRRRDRLRAAARRPATGRSCTTTTARGWR